MKASQIKKYRRTIKLWESGTLARGASNYAAYRIAKYWVNDVILDNTTESMLATHGSKQTQEVSQ